VTAAGAPAILIQAESLGAFTRAAPAPLFKFETGCYQHLSACYTDHMERLPFRRITTYNMFLSFKFFPCSLLDCTSVNYPMLLSRVCDFSLKVLLNSPFSPTPFTVLWTLTPQTLPQSQFLAYYHLPVAYFAWLSSHSILIPSGSRTLPCFQFFWAYLYIHMYTYIYIYS